jgi:hypothetical protein
MRFFYLLTVILLASASMADERSFPFYQYTCEYFAQQGKWVETGAMSWTGVPTQLAQGQNLALGTNGETSSDGSQHLIHCEVLSGVPGGVMAKVVFAPLDLDQTRVDPTCRIEGTNSVTVFEKVLTSPNQTFAASYDAGFDQTMQFIGFFQHAATPDEVLAACLKGADEQTKLNPPQIRNSMTR